MAKLLSMQISNFRTIGQTETLTLNDINVFIGGNNSGKTSSLKALLLARFGISTLLKRMVVPRDSIRNIQANDPRVLTKNTMYVAQGDLADFHELPVENAEGLYRLKQRTQPISVSLNWDNGWGITLNFTRPSGLTIMAEPVEIRRAGATVFNGGFRRGQNGNKSVNLSTAIPVATERREFLQTLVDFAISGPVLVPCTVGMPLREDIVNYGRVAQLIASGRVNLTIRNVIRLIPAADFAAFNNTIQQLFGFTLERPQLDEETDVSVTLPYVETRTGIPSFSAEAAELGSGAQQIIYLLAFIYRNLAASQFLLDEPDSHLHPYYVSRLIDALLQTIVGRGKQVFLATHSDVMIRALRVKAPRQVALFSCNGQGDISEITESTELITHLTSMGYDDARLPHTLSILRRSGRVTFVEGPFDQRMLLSLIRPIDNNLADQIERNVAFVPLRGTGQSRLAIVGGVGFLGSLMGTMTWKGLVVFDRDFHPPQRIGFIEGAMTRATAEETGGAVRRVVLHRVYCIENYVLLDRTLVQNHFNVTEPDLRTLLCGLRALHDNAYVTDIVRQGSSEARRLALWAGEDPPADYPQRMRESLDQIFDAANEPWALLSDYGGRRVLGHLMKWRENAGQYTPVARDPAVPEPDTTREFERLVQAANPATYAGRLTPILDAFRELLA